MLFDERNQESDQQTSNVIGKVQDYIRDHLNGELSLTKRSELVYLSPSYLSKLYRSIGRAFR